MKYCSKCEKEFNEDFKVCPFCGEELNNRDENIEDFTENESDNTGEYSKNINKKDRNRLLGLGLLILIVFAIVIISFKISDYKTNSETDMQTTQTTVPSTTETTTRYSVDREKIMNPSQKPIMKAYCNSAHGVQFTWSHKYIAPKEIKYCTIYFKFKNGVDDPAYDEMTGEDEKIIQLTGPIPSGKNLMLIDEIVCYSRDCAKVQITDIELEYMDGSKDKFWYGWTVDVVYDDYPIDWEKFMA